MSLTNDFQSGWPDLNRRPLDPQSSALTKLRHSPYLPRMVVATATLSIVATISIAHHERGRGPPSDVVRNPSDALVKAVPEVPDERHEHEPERPRNRRALLLDELGSAGRARSVFCEVRILYEAVALLAPRHVRSLSDLDRLRCERVTSPALDPGQTVRASCARHT